MTAEQLQSVYCRFLRGFVVKCGEVLALWASGLWHGVFLQLHVYISDETAISNITPNPEDADNILLRNIVVHVVT